MASGEVRVLADAGSLRALAHTTRLEILDLLREHDHLTASQCAELLGSTAKVCSYHLHVLARGGLVEEAAHEDRRKRPWRRTYEIAMSEMAGEGDEFTEAVGSAIRVAADRAYKALLAFVAARAQQTAEWQQAVTITARTVRFSPAELQEWGAAVEAITQEHVGRAQHSQDGNRRRVRLLTYGFPEVRDTPGPDRSRRGSSSQ